MKKITRPELQKVAVLYYTAAVFTFSVFLLAEPVYAHVAGTENVITKNVDKYQIAFQPYPKFASAGQNAMLNFSILENNFDIYNVNVAMVMKEKQSGEIVKQMPYKFYEFGDISIPYTFHDNADYVVTLLARINGDPKYQANPLVADFEIPVGQTTTTISPGELLIQVVPFTMALVGGLVLLFKKKNWGPQG
jgi:hypothetical protein